jgi:drug/metabolite transporter (DMT)-like permease
MAAAIVFATLSALSSACGAVLQRFAAVNQESTAAKPRWRAAIDLIRQPAWLFGALFLIGTFAFQALALYFGPLSLVQPILVLELIFTLAVRVFFLHDNVAGRTWGAALAICAGLGAFLVTASPGQGNAVPDAGDWLLAAGTRALAVVVLLLLARRGSPGRRAALFGAATAVVWSLDAAFVKVSVDTLAHSGLLGLITTWPLYAMIATGVLGMVLLQAAYAVGPLASSQATMLIVDPIASIALGAELFREPLRTSPGYAIGAVAALAVLAAGVVALSAWAPPVMTAADPKYAAEAIDVQSDIGNTGLHVVRRDPHSAEAAVGLSSRLRAAEEGGADHGSGAAQQLAVSGAQAVRGGGCGHQDDRAAAGPPAPAGLHTYPGGGGAAARHAGGAA